MICVVLMLWYQQIREKHGDLRMRISKPGKVKKSAANIAAREKVCRKESGKGE
jgi:hypothetical protein